MIRYDVLEKSTFGLVNRNSLAFTPINAVFRKNILRLTF